MGFHLHDRLKNISFLKRFRKTMVYSRLRQRFPEPELSYVDDRSKIDNAEVVILDWPENLVKPFVGIVKDYEPYPRWTKYCRFLDKNSFHYDFYNIHACDWIENAKPYDIIIGMPSSDLSDLLEIRSKYFLLENLLGKTCYPSSFHAYFYENKSLEEYISQISGFPFVTTYISHDKEDALRLVENLTYPMVSKIDPSSASTGVELVRSAKQGRKIVKQAFSTNGRKVHVNYFRQKNYIFFQDYVPNDGYDIRVIVVGNRLFGYYRKVLKGDFRASGMNQVEKKALPEKAMRIALEVNKILDSPQLVVDMVHGLEDKYYIIEISPFCQMETPEQLQVEGVPGVYIYENDGSFRFESGRFWVHELALKEFFEDYLSKIVFER